MAGSAHVTNGGSDGMISTARIEIPYPRISKVKFWDKTSQKEMHISFNCSPCLFGKHERYIGNIHHLW